MPGPDLQMVRLFPEFPDRAVQLGGGILHCAASAGGALQQVGPTYVAHENEISGQRADGLRAALVIGNKKGEVLRRVTGSVRGPNADFSKRDLRAVAQRLRMLESITRVSPILRARGG